MEENTQKREYLLESRGLVKAYGGKRVVNGTSINVKQGEIVGLLGPNGAGKTTSFYMIVGLVKQDEGEIFFQGEDISHVPMYKRARMGNRRLSRGCLSPSCSTPEPLSTPLCTRHRAALRTARSSTHLRVECTR